MTEMGMTAQDGLSWFLIWIGVSGLIGLVVGLFATNMQHIVQTTPKLKRLVDEGRLKKIAREAAWRASEAAQVQRRMNIAALKLPPMPDAAPGKIVHITLSDQAMITADYMRMRAAGWNILDSKEEKRYHRRSTYPGGWLYGPTTTIVHTWWIWESPPDAGAPVPAQPAAPTAPTAAAAQEVRLVLSDEPHP